MSINNPRTGSEISQAIVDEMKTNGVEVSTNKGSVVYDTVSADSNGQAAVEKDLYDELQEKFLSTCKNTDNIVKHCERCGVFRIEGVYSSGVVEISIAPGGLISAGTQVYSSQNPDVTYSTLSSVSGDISGITSVNVQCDFVGEQGNAIANSIDSFVVAPIGSTSVNNTNAFAGGKDTESDEELRTRGLKKQGRPGSSGNKYHYQEWVQDVEGTGKSRVFPQWNGQPYNVKVLFLNSSQTEPDAALIAEVDAYIQQEKPTGAIVVVDKGIEVVVDYSVDIIIKDGYNETTVTENIIKSITEYLAAVAFSEEIPESGTYIVSHSGFGASIQQADGVFDISNLIVNGGTTDILLQQEEYPEAGVGTIGYI